VTNHVAIGAGMVLPDGDTVTASSHNLLEFVKIAP
jgi:hypothetical protein